MFSDPMFLLGFGPNGAEYYDLLPANRVLALNGAAINYHWRGRVFGDENCYRYRYYYDRKPGELRIGPESCGNDFDYYIPENLLAFGASVVGTTLRWLFDIGVRWVILCGVDMYGHHADGTSSGHDELWPQVDRLQAVIDRLSASGMIIQTLSSSALSLEMINAETIQLNT